MDADLLEELKGALEREHLSSVNDLLTHIVVLYLRGDLSPAPAAEDPRVAELATLLQQQQEYFESFGEVLRNAARQPKPQDFQTKADRVLAALHGTRRSFARLSELLDINQEELLIILGDLISGGKVGYDDKMRYYKL